MSEVRGREAGGIASSLGAGYILGIRPATPAVGHETRRNRRLSKDARDSPSTIE